jgi:hypothetical protein
MDTLLSPAQVAEFENNGLLVLRGFYDVERSIRPIQRGIHQIIGLVIAKHGLSIPRAELTDDSFDSGYQELIRINRKHGGEVYDAVKQIPAFMRLVTDSRLEQLLCELRKTTAAGIAAAGYGIRIDNPGEERYRATWHQEYLGQLRSMDGLGFWMPLHHVDASLGAVEFCLGSHREGLLKVRDSNPDQPDKTGAYGLLLDREDEVVSRFPRVAPETDPGDLALFDFLTIHRSGFNRSNRARWSMQTRYFNFNDPTGIRIGWAGSYASNRDVRNIHPEVFVGREGPGNG